MLILSIKKCNTYCLLVRMVKKIILNISTAKKNALKANGPEITVSTQDNVDHLIQVNV